MTIETDGMSSTGLVIIGRNEGERLIACLRSVPPGVPVVYVDSGSTDGSIAVAASRGAQIVELSTQEPFTAARARNAGSTALLACQEQVQFVQMLDGDCSLDPDWLTIARYELVRRPDCAVVFGRRRERFPEHSIYNRLCDDEWDVPIGEVNSCGGDALFRRTALDQAGGYSADLIAGEEPDLCLRLRSAGWKIRRLDAEMSRHDAAITRLSQWFRRSLRSGHAFAELHWRHRSRSDPQWLKQLASMAVWAGALPLAILAGTLVIGPTALLAVLLYPLQMLRIAARLMREGRPPALAGQLAAFLVLGKFPSLLGAGRFYRGQAFGGTSSIIEYKSTVGRAHEVS